MALARQVKVSTRVTASLGFNNLTTDGTDLAYAHGSEAVVVTDGATSALSGGPANTLLLPDRSSSAVTQVRYLKKPEVPFEMLAVLSHRHASIYADRGQKLLHSISFGKGMPPGSYLRGVCGCTSAGASYLFFGSSGNGDLLRLALLNPKPTFGSETALPGLCSGAVSDLATGPNGILAAAAGTNLQDGSSEIVVMSVGADGTPAITCRFPADAPSLCTSLRIRGSQMLAAYSTGQVKLFDLGSEVCVAAVGAHARWINALELHPTKEMFACVAEDGYVSVWKMSGTSNKISHVAHIHAPDALLTGVAFVGANGQFVAATAYDVDAVLAWGLD